MKVAIVYGGFSSEKQASAENAKYIEKALQTKGYDTYMVPYEKGFVQSLKEIETDIVYVCVQGKGHGDGTVQRILEQEGILFTGSDSRAAAVINDKIVSKKLFDQFGLRTPRWETLEKEVYEQGLWDANTFGYPFVAKAPSEGGSFGIVLIRNEDELHLIKEVFAYESPILIEEFIPGDFYTIGVLEQKGEVKTLPCVQGLEMQGGHEKDDPDSLKVFTGDYAVREASLPEDIIYQMDVMTKEVFRITDARGIARIDFMVAKKDLQPYILEINAVPGLKPRSLLPGEAKLAGISYEDLIEGVLLEAWEKRR
ncbi:MAG: ATP-grasp domain-containing protein [Lachnospiraceae bacterium]|nr:ATP-grasp domain-containing protein [Lachnospiraceae bacterium]